MVCVLMVLQYCILPSFGVDIYVIPKDGILSSMCWLGGRDNPCQTLSLGLRGLEQHNQSTLWIEEGTYHLNEATTHNSINHSYTFFGMNDLAIYSLTANLVNVICSNVDEENNAGLTFINSTNITIHGIVFDGCGAYHDIVSARRNHLAISDYPNMKFPTFVAALYFVLCKSVVLEYVHINGTSGIGAVMHNTMGTNVIQNCDFSNNVADQSLKGGGGLYIEFSECIPDLSDRASHCTQGSNVLNFGGQYTIDNSSFYSNLAILFNQPHTTANKDDHVAFGHGGGGLSVFFKGAAHSNVVIVRNSLLQLNKAIWGAGVFVQYQGCAQNNTFVMEHSSIVSNECYCSLCERVSTGGGGARVGFIGTNSCMFNNSIKFDDVEFSDNGAYFGGGLSYHTSREVTRLKPTNTLNFHNCLWHNNIGRVGSAVDLALWDPTLHGSTVEAVFSSCSFFNNSANYEPSLTSHLLGIGALYTDSVSVVLLNKIWFQSNKETALAAMNAGIYLQEDCQATFFHNSGRNGGAVALLGFTFVQVSRRTMLKFIGNVASIKGGAIYSEHHLVSSRNCFIRYNTTKTSPFQWETTFNFENNTADGSVNSIYVTSLLICLWRRSNESIEEAMKVAFCWNDGHNEDHWIYSSGNCSQEIATSPAYFALPYTNFTYNTVAFPGKEVYVPIVVLDDRGYNITDTTVLEVSVLSGPANANTISLDSSSLYVTNNILKLYGEPGTVETLKVETTIHPIIFTKVNITLLNCPPGLTETGHKSNVTCKCDGNYDGYVLCNSTDFQAAILRGSWMGLSTVSNQLVVGQCPYCSLIGDEPFIQLPQNISDLPNYMCRKINRTGELCGRCIDGYGPVVNSKHFQCVLCPPAKAKYHWIFFILTEFLPILILFFIVVLLNISATSGPANAFVFFAQVVTAGFSLYSDGAIQVKSIRNVKTILTGVYMFPYEIWNLNFFRSFSFTQFCLSSNISVLALFSIGYLTAFFPFLLVLVFFITVSMYSRGVKLVVCILKPIERLIEPVLHFLRIDWSLEKSVLGALATFLLLSYTKFSLLSFLLLTPTPLVTSNDSRDHLVLYYDGTVGFGSKAHAPYIVLSVLVLTTVVALPPIILIFPSICLLLQKVLRIHFHYERDLPSFSLNTIIGQFLNTFHACYKDGQGSPSDQNEHDFRWFAGMYFIFRLMVFSAYAFTPEWFMQYVILQFVCVTGLLAFAVLRPYKNDWYNKLDAIMFGLLTVINALSMYNYFLTLEYEASAWVFSIQYFLVMCPLIYMIVIVLHSLVRKCRQRESCLVMKQPNLNEDEDDVTLITLIEESEYERRSSYHQHTDDNQELPETSTGYNPPQDNELKHRTSEH